MNNLMRVLFLGLISFNATASDKEISDAVGVLSQKIQQQLPINQIAPSGIPGLSQVSIDAKIIYITDDGKYAFLGNMLAIHENPKNWNLTEQATNKLRSGLLHNIKQQQPIVYKATTNKIGEVIVFTDIDCGYSKKMHKQIAEYNDLGIEVIFLAYPSARTQNSTTYERTQAIWCSADPLESLDLVAAKGKNIEARSCENPIKDHMKLGQRLGVTGTPAIFLNNGVLLSGYVTPEQLVKALQDA